MLSGMMASGGGTIGSITGFLQTVCDRDENGKTTGQEMSTGEMLSTENEGREDK